jgi:hypothetical protein
LVVCISKTANYDDLVENVEKTLESQGNSSFLAGLGMFRKIIKCDGSSHFSNMKLVGRKPVSKVVMVGDDDEIVLQTSIHDEKLVIPPTMSLLEFHKRLLQSRLTEPCHGNAFIRNIETHKCSLQHSTISFSNGFELKFKRTLKIPDVPGDETLYPLPPSFGNFPSSIVGCHELQHVAFGASAAWWGPDANVSERSYVDGFFQPQTSGCEDRGGQRKCSVRASFCAWLP